MPPQRLRGRAAAAACCVTQWTRRQYTTNRVHPPEMKLWASFHWLYQTEWHQEGRSPGCRQAKAVSSSWWSLDLVDLAILPWLAQLSAGAREKANVVIDLVASLVLPIRTRNCAATPPPGCVDCIFVCWPHQVAWAVVSTDSRKNQKNTSLMMIPFSGMAHKSNNKSGNYIKQKKSIILNPPSSCWKDEAA